jgi:hypothetical protein
MSDTPTPRTNKAFLDGYTFCKEDMMPAVAFASQLERELTTVTAQRDEAREQIDANHKATLVIERMVYEAREQRDRLAVALECVRDYRGMVGEDDPQSVAHDALAEITTSDTPDINAIGDQFIGQVLSYYNGYTEDELTQVFARGPFAGMSERELFELAKHWDNNRKIVRLQPNANN